MRAGETAGDSERGLGERGSSLKEWPVGVAALFGCGLSMDRAGMREPSWWQPIERRLRAARWQSVVAEVREWRAQRKKGACGKQPMGHAAEACHEWRALGITTPSALIGTGDGAARPVRGKGWVGLTGCHIPKFPFQNVNCFPKQTQIF
jgi:hypothetical protein